MGYQAEYDRAMRDPEGFWAEAAGLIEWDRPWDQVLDDHNKPFYRWFSGAMLNTCHNAVDRHVAAGRGDQAAIVSFELDGRVEIDGAEDSGFLEDNRFDFSSRDLEESDAPPTAASRHPSGLSLSMKNSASA